jgi:hypothetical protein
LLGIFVDDRDAAAALHHAAQLGDGGVDIHGVLQRFGGVGAVEALGAKGQGSHGAGAGVNTCWNMAQHCLGQIEGDDRRFRIALLENPREAAFAATHVQDALAVQIAEVFDQELNVVDAGIDGGGIMFLVSRRFVEEADDFPEWRGHQARVRKMGSPVLLA